MEYVNLIFTLVAHILVNFNFFVGLFGLKLMDFS